MTIQSHHTFYKINLANQFWIQIWITMWNDLFAILIETIWNMFEFLNWFENEGAMHMMHDAMQCKKENNQF